ncbi:hypothetical protein I3F60_18050 [Streptomyces sp. MUM 136J]|uniref:hypothetical protein n=1 Tax=Streptomyces sp. MUM 136J TaxID=2791992 RepID=UPI001F04EA58|nr:hypothetical protein [Streptomyces sp. MUM 136J]MCH0571138.1 hypothetical protein [Streptomyces sp. MUM 136J]
MVRTLNRMEFVGETLRAALEALAAAVPDWLPPLIDASWVDRYGAKADNYRFPKGGNARLEREEQVGRDGFALLDAVDDAFAPAWLGGIPSVGTLRRACSEQYHRDAEGMRRWEGKDLPPASAATGGVRPVAAPGTHSRRTGRKPEYARYEDFRPARREHAPDAAP